MYAVSNYEQQCAVTHWIKWFLTRIYILLT